MTLRLANKDDLPELLRWRNDPVTRYYRDDPRFITPEEHLTWFEKNKGNIYIYDNKGQIKLDGEGEIGWIVSPEYRKQGIGKAMLCEAIERFNPQWCKIREDNLASIKLAMSCGFEYDRQEGRKIYYAR